MSENMKKLFVSVPMNGRKPDEIKKSISKMHKIAEAITGEELELIDSYISEQPPKDGKESIWYLSKSIEKLSQADVFIGITETWKWSGCGIESAIASSYGLERYFVSPEYIIDNYEELLDRDCSPKVYSDQEVIE